MLQGLISGPRKYLFLFTGRDTDSVRHFATFTRDLLALADWLHQCNIRSVAMESTGVYWIPSPVNVTREENVAAPKKGKCSRDPSRRRTISFNENECAPEGSDSKAAACAGSSSGMRTYRLIADAPT